MAYRKGELSPAMIDRDWPHQVALPACASLNAGYKAITDFCKELTLCPRGHSVFSDGVWFNVYCFADAAAFMQRFGGQTFDPAQRGKGAHWAHWRKDPPRGC